MLRSPLLRYRVVAYTVSTFFAILCLVGVPLKYGAHMGGVVLVTGAIHGFVFPLYVLLTLELAIRYRFSVVRTLLTMAAGTIPLMGFVAERKSTHFVEAREAERAEAPAAEPATPSAELT